MRQADRHEIFFAVSESSRSPKRTETSFNSIGRRRNLETVAIYVLQATGHIKIESTFKCFTNSYSVPQNLPYEISYIPKNFSIHKKKIEATSERFTDL